MPAKISSGLWLYPWDFEQTMAANAGFGALTLDSATEYASQIFLVQTQGLISKIGFRTGNVSAAGTADIRIETVASRGPSGTLYQTLANAQVPVTAGGWVTATLESATLVHYGSAVAVKVQMTATAGAIGSFQANTLDFAQQGGGRPHRVSFVGTTTSFATGTMAFGVEYSDGTYPPALGLMAASAVSSNAYNSGSTGFDEFGVLFSLPFPAQCFGGAVWVNLATGTANLVLYDSDGSTVMTSATMDPGEARASAGGIHRYLFPASMNLVAGGSYRLTMVPLTATNVIANALIGSSQAAAGQITLGGTFIGTQRVNSGSWTDDPRQRPVFGLLLDGFDDGTSTGGTTVVTGGAWGF